MAYALFCADIDGVGIGEPGKQALKSGLSTAAEVGQLVCRRETTIRMAMRMKRTTVADTPADFNAGLEESEGPSCADLKLLLKVLCNKFATIFLFLRRRGISFSWLTGHGQSRIRLMKPTQGRCRSVDCLLHHVGSWEVFVDLRSVERCSKQILLEWMTAFALACRTSG